MPSLLIVSTLRIKIAIDVVLAVSKAVHSDPMTQVFHLFPHVGIVFPDPRLHEGLFVCVDGYVEPTAQAGNLLAQDSDIMTLTYI